MSGTPLRKFGAFQVFQTRRGKHPWFSVCDAGGERVVFSEVKASAYLAAERLGCSVAPLMTPTETLEASLALYAGLYPTRFRYYDHLYVVIGNGMEWINGGLADTDVTRLTPEGIAWTAQKQAAQDAARAGEEEFLREIRAKVRAESDAEDAAIRAQYAAGTWPDAMTRENQSERHRRRCGEGYPLNVLYPACEYSRLHALLSLETVDPAWLEDARRASVVLLTHGVDMPEHGRNSRATLTSWAKRLAARFGGQWLPGGVS